MAGELNEVVNGSYLLESSACADGVAQQGFPWATLLVEAGENRLVVQVGKTNV